MFSMVMVLFCRCFHNSCDELESRGRRGRNVQTNWQKLFAWPCWVCVFLCATCRYQARDVLLLFSLLLCCHQLCHHHPLHIHLHRLSALPYVFEQSTILSLSHHEREDNDNTGLRTQLLTLNSMLRVKIHMSDTKYTITVCDHPLGFICMLKWSILSRSINA